MATVLVVSSVKDLLVAASTVVGKYEVAITDSNGVGQKQEVDSPSAVFADVAPGDYVASVVLLDSAGGQLGEKATAVFSVSAPAQVNVSVADVVTVTVS